jgi:nucleoside-diphosphate-sugar epimerase
MKRCLITGSSGFIGTRLLNLLKGTDCDIRLLARRVNSNYETIICNLGKDKIPQLALESVDTIFHLAGLAHDLHNNSKDEKLYNLVNVNATLELAELAVRIGVKRFIFVSSVKAGGSAVAGQCMTEKDQGEPEGIYGKTKRKAELKLLDIERKSDMHVSIVRPSLVYGPDVKGNLNLMLSAIEKGWFPPLPETGNRRSMIHVDDLVCALLLVTDDQRANGEIFIATDDVPHSSREIYEAMCTVLDKSVPRWRIPRLLFNIVAAISPAARYKISKLLGDECYSTEKLKSLGFKVQRSLREMNETSF